MRGTAEAQKPLVLCRMNVGVAHSEVNPNTRVMSSRGIWLAYVISVAALHVILLSIPFFSIPVVWTLTNVIHNLVSRGSAAPSRGRIAGVCQPCQRCRAECCASSPGVGSAGAQGTLPDPVLWGVRC